MHNRSWLVTASFVVLSSALYAQRPASPDVLEGLLFPPDLIMAKQSEIGLSDAQQTFLHDEVVKAQARFTDLEWQLSSAMEGLAGLLKQPKADEAQVNAQLDKVLAAEREIKHAQISLMVRIKNNLTPEQQHRLAALRGAPK